MEAAMPLAIAGVIKAGMLVVGSPVAMYFTSESSEGGENGFTCGPIVATGTTASERSGFEAREVGVSRCVTLVYVRPYDKMIAAYSGTFEWIEVKGNKIHISLMEVF